jgi:hypothetical protein
VFALRGRTHPELQGPQAVWSVGKWVKNELSCGSVDRHEDLIRDMQVKRPFLLRVLLPIVRQS